MSKLGRTQRPRVLLPEVPGHNDGLYVLLYEDGTVKIGGPGRRFTVTEMTTCEGGSTPGAAIHFAVEKPRRPGAPAYARAW